MDIHRLKPWRSVSQGPRAFRIRLYAAKLLACVSLSLLPLSAWSAPSQEEVVITPSYSPAPELTLRPGAPRGVVRTFVMRSSESRIYPGVARDRPGEVVPYERTVHVYIPAQYRAGQPAALLVVQDGDDPKYRDRLPVVLDNLIAEKRVPVTIAVMVHNGGGNRYGSERGLEYDTVSDRYLRFIESEVLPRVARAYGVRFTRDPEGRAAMGGSSGAAAAFTMAWFHPELYRRVLSYSGTFVNEANLAHPEITRGAWEYHQTLIPGAARKPIRIWMQVSDGDIDADAPEASLHNWVLANRHMAQALRMKGYDYRFVFAKGAGHVDPAVVDQTLPDALVWLWAGYRAR
jgi:iron(III)-enterobactin esterase